MTTFTHRFVEFIPEALEEGVLYISLAYGTVSHRCACGCGREVVTPLTPTDWKLTFDGETITLFPSIGNWDYPCRSHYWIRDSRVQWAEHWSKYRVRNAAARDCEAKNSYYASQSREAPSTPPHDGGKRPGLWARLRKRWRQ